MTYNKTKTKQKPFLSSSEFAEAIGIETRTVQKWDNNGYLPAHHKTPTGRRCYAREQIQDYFDGKYSKSKS